MQTIVLVTTERVIWYGGWTTSCSSLRTRRVTRYADNCVSHHRKSDMVWGVGINHNHVSILFAHGEIFCSWGKNKKLMGTSAGFCVCVCGGGGGYPYNII